MLFLQMLQQDQASRDAEAKVISGFNTKLLAKISAFKSANSGVSPPRPAIPSTELDDKHLVYYRYQLTSGTHIPNLTPF